ncbi:hypothetical protein ASD91_04570 [Pseudomonas sp. Root68]|nr:hypothetical protein ASD91_04570 [Pseudomonas sp. Root68]KRB68730.1 hypothetical protein ASD95_05815 [Pseudomonas sp. Root71]
MVRKWYKALSTILRAFVYQSFMGGSSNIGATLKRRESEAGVTVVTDMGDLESVRWGGGEVGRLGGGEFIRNGLVGRERVPGRFNGRCVADISTVPEPELSQR